MGEPCQARFAHFCRGGSPTRPPAPRLGGEAMKMVGAAAFLCVMSADVAAQNSERAFNSYLGCLDRAACDFDDKTSDAGTIAKTVASICVNHWVAAMEARGSSPGLAYGMKEKQIEIATMAVLAKRRGRVRCP